MQYQSDSAVESASVFSQVPSRALEVLDDDALAAVAGASGVDSFGPNNGWLTSTGPNGGW